MHGVDRRPVIDEGDSPSRVIFDFFYDVLSRFIIDVVRPPQGMVGLPTFSDESQPEALWPRPLLLESNIVHQSSC